MIISGDSLNALTTIADETFQTCVTSPPYWGLRDYAVDGQLGMENSPEEYVEKLVLVFRQVKRVLKTDGTLWLNLGDSYTSGGRNSRGHDKPTLPGRHTKTRAPTPKGLKPKDLVGIPWRVAFALQADGWYLRQCIIWNKPNVMPESVRDRCTNSHEYIFLLAKSAKYYFDQAAIKEPCVSLDPNHKSYRGNSAAIAESGVRKVFSAKHEQSARFYSHAGRNKRSVWTITTKPFKGAHFATFPPDLVEPCILAGSRPGDSVLDPFLGSGTTALVAERLGRSWTGVELSEQYCEIARRRIQNA